MTTETCFADDCLRYFAYLEGYMSTPEPMFLLANALHDMGLGTFLVIKLLIWATPLVFSLGLYLLLRKRVSIDTMLLVIFFANASLSFNLFWFVLLKNAMMIAAFPFMLHFFLEGKYAKSILFLVIMALSHMTFALLIVPLLAYALYYEVSSRKFALAGLFITGVMVAYYLLAQGSIVSATGATNLNYLFIDILLLFMAAATENDAIKWILVANAVILPISLLFVQEAWRLAILINVPSLLGAATFIDRKRIQSYILLYAMAEIIMMVFYVMTLRPYL